MIELLVVISVISLFASMIMVQVNEAKLRAEDARRVLTLGQIERALFLYYDEFGQYPGITPYTDPQGGSGPQANEAYPPCPGSPGNNSWCELKTKLQAYIELPLYNGTTDLILYDSDPSDGYQSYGLLVRVYSLYFRRLAEKDGGQSSALYEKGDQPAYCKKYGENLIQGSWFYASLSRCFGYPE